MICNFKNCDKYVVELFVGITSIEKKFCTEGQKILHTPFTLKSVFCHILFCFFPSLAFSVSQIWKGVFTPVAEIFGIFSQSTFSLDGTKLYVNCF